MKIGITALQDDLLASVSGGQTLPEASLPVPKPVKKPDKDSFGTDPLPIGTPPPVPTPAKECFLSPSGAHVYEGLFRNRRCKYCGAKQ